MAEELRTYCRICEPLCGMVATVQDGRVTQLRPDREHPVSRGFACPKGVAFTEVQNDPDRVLHPLRRRADGSFERVSWQAAMDDITARLGAIIRRDGGDAVGWYFGNPSAFSISHSLAVPLFLQAIGSPHGFSAGSQDVNNRFVASHFLYGTQLIAPIPDLPRCDLLVVIGANPVVSHGSVLTAPRIKEELHGIVDRGGRVVVVDPRRTETAKLFEWLPITPDADAHLLLSLLHVLFEEGLADQAALARQAGGAEGLRALAAPFSPEATAEVTGIDAEAVRELAHALATTPRAAVYGRTGTCLGRHGTLTTFLLDAVNAVAGNLDREGGAMFGDLGVPGTRTLTALLERALPVGYDSRRSRIGGFPQVLGTEPATILAKEITTPGKGQIRAFFVSAGNPVLSAPDGEELEEALERLELMVSLDLYVNETNCHADYVLPAVTMYERDDFPLPFQQLQTTPLRQATKAVVPPAGEAREEWDVVEELLDGLQGASRRISAVNLLRRGLRLARMPLKPMRIAGAVIRIAEGGDRFGLRRGGLNLRRLLEDHPSGKVVAPHLSPDRLPGLVVHRDRRVHLDVPEIRAEVEALRPAREGDADLPLRLIGMRELRSENSWMHNAPLLSRGGRVHAARMHPVDAAAIGVQDGATIRLVSRQDAIELPVRLTEDLKPGVVAVPHGWGHRGTGGWQQANRLGGANVNQLMSTDPADVERLAGMAHLNGVPVRAEAVEPARRGEPVAAAAAD